MALTKDQAPDPWFMSWRLNEKKGHIRAWCHICRVSVILTDAEALAAGPGLTYGFGHGRLAAAGCEHAKAKLDA